MRRAVLAIAVLALAVQLVGMEGQRPVRAVDSEVDPDDAASWSGWEDALLRAPPQLSLLPPPFAPRTPGALGPVATEVTLATGMDRAEPEVTIDTSTSEPSLRLLYTVNHDPASDNMWGARSCTGTCTSGTSWQAPSGSAVMTSDNSLSFDGAGWVATLDGVRQPGPSSVEILKWDATNAIGSLQHMVGQGTAFTMPDGSTRTACGNHFDYPRLRASGGVLYLAASTRLSIPQGCDTSRDWEIYATSTDGGVSLSDARALPHAEHISVQDVVVASDGGVYLAGLSRPETPSLPGCPPGATLRVWIVSSSSSTGFIERCPNSASSPKPFMVGDPGNAANLWVVYAAPVDGYDHVFSIKSTDRGQTWGSPVRIDAVQANDNVNHESPVIAAVAGRLDVAWVDFRAQNDGAHADIYYASSSDGGVSWGSETRVTPGPRVWSFNGNDYIGIASSPSHAFLAYSFKQDGGSPDWYVAQIDV